MPFLTDLLTEKRDLVSGMKNAMPLLVNVFGGMDTASGKNVNENVALSLTAVYSCIKIIAWNMASLPVITYKSLEPRGKERDKKYYLYKLLHDAPNEVQTSFEWISLMSVHQNLWGAGISEIEFDGNGNPIALWPLPPWLVTPKKIKDSRQLVYEVDVENKKYTLRSNQVVCFRSLGTGMYDNWMSPIAIHRETIGAALAVKEFGAKTFGQGTNPSGIIEMAGAIKEGSEDSLRKKLGQYSGLGGSHRLMLLDNGMKFNRIGIPPKDSQFLESKSFDIAEIARVYNIPLHKLQELSKSTSFGSGIEEMNLDFVSSTLRPYLVQWEQEIKRKLIFDEHFVEFLVAGLLRGKLTERYNAYKTGQNTGFISPDDIREFENMNPIPGGIGNVYMVPLNMQALEFAKEKKEPAPAPAPADEGTDDNGNVDDNNNVDDTVKPKEEDDEGGDDATA
jgi:HK97 family phage portal protein